ncbi:hypothetical protein [Zobellia sp. B3R18]|uniref:hypothetical protein n=1 Tax=Zobellia sp. B3R18 TaxID=2841568 RepID=UPI001C072090|nr:hypothetical protein [Zobellia sp. B3R18]MBU2974988.1 hypothetical protein [Zobellia sp. B3R18]
MNIVNHKTLDTQNLIKAITNQDNQQILPFKKHKAIGKQYLWKLFLHHFKTIYNRPFEKTPKSLTNLRTLFYYFLKNEQFLDQPNLRADLSEPSFNKGLLIIGGYGVGKTAYMRAIENSFRANKIYYFKTYTTNSVVQEFEQCGTHEDKSWFLKKIQSGSLLFDDLTSERLASNYGKADLMKEILEERYRRRKLTHVTMNYLENHESNVEAALEAIGMRYGSRIYDRLFEMFNIVIFEGKSMRR